MASHIPRRKFLATLLGGAAAWPLAAQAQQQLNPVVGFLSGRSPVEALGVVAAFRKGLSESGFVEPQNVTIDFRWAARSERGTFRRERFRMGLGKPVPQTGSFPWVSYVR